ncbi:MAG: AraC family transcriptional regulator [Tissierellia bacterium]|nr:AraC family transcriptional regulator [Tissierellia bacterium]
MQIDKSNFYKKSDWNYKKLGETYTVKEEFCDGICWIYSFNNSYSWKIDKLNFNTDAVLDTVIPDRYTLVLYISVAAEEFYPYQSLSPNTLRYYEPNERYKVIYHPQVELKAVSIDFSSEFIEKHLKDKWPDLNIDFSQLFKNKGNLYLPKINQIMYEVANFDEDAEIAKIFYESKVYEIISMMVLYLNSNKKNEQANLNLQDEIAIKEITSYIEDHYNFNIKLSTLSKIACMSESKLKTSFKLYHNFSITEYIQRLRMQKAEHLLISTDMSIKEIAKIVGYKNPSRFSELFKRYKGLSPKDFKKLITESGKY